MDVEENIKIEESDNKDYSNVETLKEIIYKNIFKVN